MTTTAKRRIVGACLVPMLLLAGISPAASDNRGRGGGGRAPGGINVPALIQTAEGVLAAALPDDVKRFVMPGLGVVKEIVKAATGEQIDWANLLKKGLDLVIALVDKFVPG